MKRHIIATVPQGVGDIFWCYQKLKPHCDKITFRIAVIDDRCNVQARAENIIQHLPGVRDVTLKKMRVRDYDALINGNYDLALLLRNPRDPLEINYSVNLKLDNGVPLESIDALPVKYDIELPFEPLNSAYIQPGKYLLFYCSGTTSNAKVRADLKLWTAKQWADMIGDIMDATGLPAYLIGAHFDHDIMKQIQNENPRIGGFVQPDPRHLFWLLKNCAFFAGYQSGLSILADNLGARHVIVYFDRLPNMRDSWAHPDRRKTHFKYCFFSDGAAMLKSLVVDWFP